MSVSASILLSVALALRPEVGLRIVNPHPVAVDSTLSCGEASRTLHLEAHALLDLGADALCANPTLDSALPLLTLETAGEGEQRRIASDDDACAPITMSAPLFACEHGVATASVPQLERSTYAWTAEGATIAEGANTSRVKVELGATESVKLVCKVTHGGCTTEATGVIAIRKPLLIHELKVPAEADAAKPVTITWSYEPGAAPNAQLLTGDVFAAPVVVPGGQRSYTFTPAASGTRSVELLASYATSILLPTAPRGRRRAVGATLATATQCPSVRSSKQIAIRGCTLGTPEILMPADVEAGTSFLASVDAGAGDSVSWDVKHGTLLTPNYLHQIEVRADELVGAVELTVVVTRGAVCTGTATRSLVVSHRRAVRHRAELQYGHHPGHVHRHAAVPRHLVRPYAVRDLRLCRDARGHEARHVHAGELPRCDLHRHRHGESESRKREADRDALDDRRHLQHAADEARGDVHRYAAVPRLLGGRRAVHDQ
jgi:hypothetical protein